jgi:hypothetical protein
MSKRPRSDTLQGTREKEAVMALATEARIGDLVVVEGHRVGERQRIGEILEILGDPGHEHYRVRWDDDHESVFYPSGDATIKAARRQ